MARNRASQAELVARREEIQQFILEGMRYTDIVSAMSEKWKTSKRAIAEDISIIGKDWSERAEESSQKMRNRYADRLEMLFNKSLDNNNLKTALEIQKEIHKLNGLYAEKEKEENKIPEFINIGKKSKLKMVQGTKDTDGTEH